jgi:hypothetical protein
LKELKHVNIIQEEMDVAGVAGVGMHKERKEPAGRLNG